MEKYSEKDSFAVTLGKKIGLSLLDIAGASEQDKKEYLERVDEKMAENKVKKEEREKKEMPSDYLEKFLTNLTEGKKPKTTPKKTEAKSKASTSQTHPAKST